MGTVSSACQNCFGAKQSPPEPKKGKAKYKTLMTEENNSTHHSNLLEMSRSFNSGVGARFGRSRTTNLEPLNKKNNGDNDKKDKKPSIKDFALIKVTSQSNDNPYSRHYFRSWEEVVLEKFTLFKKRVIGNSMH